MWLPMISKRSKKYHAKRKLAGFICLLGITAVMVGQRVPQYTQYMYNTISINPAYDGNNGGLTIVGLHRNQWLGLDSSPKTYMLSVNSAFSDGKMNGGLSVVHDSFGFTQDTYFNLDYSYSLSFRNRNTLSFGIKAGVINRKNSFQDLNFFQANDPAFQNTIGSEIRPSLGVGAYFNNDTFYAGISALNLLQNYKLNTNESEMEIVEQGIFYGIMGYVFELNDSFKFKPAALIKYAKGAPIQFDLSLNALMYNKFIVGAAYRHESAISGLLGFYVKYNTLIGISYDRDITDISGIEDNFGSFELMIRFNLFNEHKKFLPTRFF